MTTCYICPTESQRNGFCRKCDKRSHLKFYPCTICWKELKINKLVGGKCISCIDIPKCNICDDYPHSYHKILKKLVCECYPTCKQCHEPVENNECETCGPLCSSCFFPLPRYHKFNMCNDCRPKKIKQNICLICDENRDFLNQQNICDQCIKKDEELSSSR